MKAAMLLLLVVALAGAHAVSAKTFNDTDILNFALNLECLEAEFYSWAAFGVGLNSTLRGGGPASTGGQKANLTAATQAYATEIANDEIKHVAFLRSALGALAVPCPVMELDASFAAAANAAAGATLSPSFSPYGSDTAFLIGAYIFEDVGVTAYLGALGAFSSRALLNAAAAIGNVEAYHASLVRTLLYETRTSPTGYTGVNVAAITGLISNLRDAADGNTADQDVNIVTAADGSQIVAADANALAFSRSPAEVLGIVYLGNASQPGGFYPSGIQGGIAAGDTPQTIAACKSAGAATKMGLLTLAVAAMAAFML